MLGRGRNDSNGQQDKSHTPRASSVTPSHAPSQAGSAASKGKRRKKKTKATDKENADPNAQKKNKAARNKQNPMTQAQAEKLLKKIYGGAQPVQGNNDVMPNDKGNDIPVNKKNIVRNDFAYAQKNNKDGRWSNYPVSLPPRFTTDIIKALRRSLLTVNNDDLLKYYGQESGAITWEYGLLECYEGITEDSPGNFLSCDFVNPKYIREMQKPKEFRQKVASWLSQYSSFVYAPIGSILCGGIPVGSQKTSIPLAQAKSNWNKYARDQGSIPKVVSVDDSGVEVVAHFWLYKEEFIDFENRPKDPTHPKFEAIKSKGRISMFFPIHPIEVKDTHHLKWIDVPEDSVGWGIVGNIGQQLEADQIPTTWKNLQAHIGKYILLTNVWSSDSSDEYEVFVDPQIVKHLYKAICEMTKGDMFVNVRRGCMPYGPLCVVRKNIVVDPRDDKFGLEQGGGKLDLYVTQIFACGNALSQNYMRQEIKRYWEKEGMSDEERKMCSIVQTFNKNMIERMKNEGYRNMMLEYWKTATNRLDGMIDGQWSLPNMKLLMLNMISTAYNLILEKGVCKVASGPRYYYLSHIFTNYPQWFQASKCLPDADFLKTYEDNLRKEQLDEQSFSGMWTKYVNTNPNSTQPQNNAKPRITRPDEDQINRLILMPAPEAANGYPGPPSAPKADVNDMALDPQASQKEMQTKAAIKTNVHDAVKKLVHTWGTTHVSSVEADKKWQIAGLFQYEQMRTKLAYDIYIRILQDSTNDDAEVKFERVFEILYTTFIRQMMQPEYQTWFGQEELNASV